MDGKELDIVGGILLLEAKIVVANVGVLVMFGQDVQSKSGDHTGHDTCGQNRDIGYIENSHPPPALKY